MEIIEWKDLRKLNSHGYTCGYCNAQTNSKEGWCGDPHGVGQDEPRIYICGGCGRPTYFLRSAQVPSPVLGSRVVNDLPETVEMIYEEARQCTTVGAHTSCVLTCRILLTHLAVERGADKSVSFRQAVDYLIENEDIPKNSREWVDFVRLEGNRANHELVLMTREDADRILSLVEMVLSLIYEYPARIKPE